MTPEVIAAMAARGWTHDPKYNDFRCGGGTVEAIRDAPTPAIYGWIYPTANKLWMADYGTRGHGWGTMKRHPDPMAAADEAEAWFRHVVAGLPGVRQPPG
jgi:hypothetical protein